MRPSTTRACCPTCRPPSALSSLFDGSSANERVVTVVSNYEQAAAIQHGVQERLRDQKGERAGGCDAAAVERGRRRLVVVVCGEGMNAASNHLSNHQGVSPAALKDPYHQKNIMSQV